MISKLSMLNKQLKSNQTFKNYTNQMLFSNFPRTVYMLWWIFYLTSVGQIHSRVIDWLAIYYFSFVFHFQTSLKVTIFSSSSSSSCYFTCSCLFAHFFVFFLHCFAGICINGLLSINSSISHIFLLLSRWQFTIAFFSSVLSSLYLIKLNGR